MEPPLEEVRPLEEDAELSEAELVADGLSDEELSAEELLLDVEAATSESDCIVPTRANTPAAAASL